MTAALLAILSAAADNHLFQRCGYLAHQARYLNAATGQSLSTVMVENATAYGLLAAPTSPELIPGSGGNEWGRRIDLTDKGLDRYLAELEIA